MKVEINIPLYVVDRAFVELVKIDIREKNLNLLDRFKCDYIESMTKVLRTGEKDDVLAVRKTFARHLEFLCENDKDFTIECLEFDESNPKLDGIAINEEIFELSGCTMHTLMLIKVHDKHDDFDGAVKLVGHAFESFIQRRAISTQNDSYESFLKSFSKKMSCDWFDVTCTAQIVDN